MIDLEGYEGHPLAEIIRTLEQQLDVATQRIALCEQLWADDVKHFATGENRPHGNVEFNQNPIFSWKRRPWTTRNDKE